MSNSTDITEKEFGFLKVLEYAGKKNDRAMWKCECKKCGNIVVVAASSLKNGNTRSCGCLRKEMSSKTGAKRAAARKDFVDGTSLSALTRKTPTNNKSGVKGVFFEKKTERWRANIWFKGKSHYLGSFENKEDAIKARKKAEKEMFGSVLEEFKQQKSEEK